MMKSCGIVMHYCIVYEVNMQNSIYIYSNFFIFSIDVIKMCKPLSKLHLPTPRQGSIEGRTQQRKNMAPLGFEPRTSASCADAPPTELLCQWTIPKF